MRCARRFAALAVALCAVGCTAAPKETVELAEITDRQIAEMQSSHEKFVRLHFIDMRERVDRFMAGTWTPQFLSRVIEGNGAEGRRFRASLDRGYKLSTLDWSTAVNLDAIQDPQVKEAAREALRELATKERAVLGQVLIGFSNGVQKQINERRRTLMEPIDRQEAEVLDHLRAGYADLLRGNAAVKAYLASVVNITQERDVILRRLGLLDEQREAVRVALEAGDRAASALESAADAEEAIDAFIERIGGPRTRERPTTRGAGRAPRPATLPVE